jgi:hypothetical protein
MIPAISSHQTPPQVAESEAVCVRHDVALSPQEQLLVLIVFSEMSRSGAAETSIDVSSQRLQHLREEARKALEAAREAQQASGFWGSISSLLNGDIATIAQLVAVAAAAVASGGTATIVLAAIAVGATLGSKYADELGLPPSVAVGLGVAAGLASVASGNVAGGASSLTGLSAAANTTRIYAQGVSVAASGTGALAGGASSYFDSEAMGYRADAQELENRQVLLSARIDDSMKLLERSLDRQLSALRSATHMIQNDHRSTQSILRDFSGAA